MTFNPNGLGIKFQTMILLELNEMSRFAHEIYLFNPPVPWGGCRIESSCKKEFLVGNCMKCQDPCRSSHADGTQYQQGRKGGTERVKKG